MMSHSPKQRLIPLLFMSVLVLALGVAVAVTFVNSTTWSELRVWLTGVYPAPSLGITFDRDLKVIGLDPGGRAELKGVKIGDVIYAVNREPVSDANHLYRIMQGNEMAERVRLGLVRQNNKLDVIIDPLPAPTNTSGAP